MGVVADGGKAEKNTAGQPAKEASVDWLKRRAVDPEAAKRSGGEEGGHLWLAGGCDTPPVNV